MDLVEFFTFLPYGKYAFYIWGSYMVSIVAIIWMFVSANKTKKKNFKELRIKYIREQKN